MANGTGVVGLGQSQPGVFGGNNDPNGSSPGVLAVGLNGTGLEGASLGAGSGVVGLTSASPPPSSFLATAGVSGFDMNRGQTASSGVFGFSANSSGAAILALAGLPIFSTSSTKINATTAPSGSTVGVAALAFGGGYAIAALSVGGSGGTGTAIVGVTDSANAAALSVANTAGSGNTFTAADDSFFFRGSGNKGFGSLDSLGNLTISGALRTGQGTVINVARSSTGAQYDAYSAHVTRPTQEDVGRPSSLTATAPCASTPSSRALSIVAATMPCSSPPRAITADCTSRSARRAASWFASRKAAVRR